MYGQMTAGSWIYIGTQGILQGTYETLAECAHQHFGGSLAGTVTLTGGLGGMGGAQPLAVTMNGGVALCVEVDPARIERRIKTRYLDRETADLDEAVALGRSGEGRARGGLDRPGRQLRRGLPGVARARVRAPTSSPTRRARTIRSAGTCPRGCRCPRPMRSRREPEEYVAALLRVDGRTRWTPWWASPRRARWSSTTATTCAPGAEEGGLAHDRAYSLSRGSCRRSCARSSAKARGRSAGRRSSGDPADIAATDRAVAELFPDNDRLQRWLRMAAERVAFQGLPARICWLGYGERDRAGERFNEMVASGEVSAPIVIGRDHLDAGSVASPEPRDRGDAGRFRRDRRLADPQRVDQHGRGRALGERAPRGRRGHRVLDPRRHGGGGRRHRERRRAARSGC